MNWTALISGLIGVLLGSLTSIGTLFIQNVYQNHRDTQRLIFDTAWKDYKLRTRYATQSTPRPAAFPVILAYHQKMIDLSEKGQLTPLAAKEILDAQAEMGEALQKAVDEIETK